MNDPIPLERAIEIAACVAWNLSSQRPNPTGSLAWTALPDDIRNQYRHHASALLHGMAQAGLTFTDTSRIVGYAVGVPAGSTAPPAIDDVHPTRAGAEDAVRELSDISEWTTHQVYEVRELPRPPIQTDPTAFRRMLALPDDDDRVALTIDPTGRSITAHEFDTTCWSDDSEPAAAHLTITTDRGVEKAGSYCRSCAAEAIAAWLTHPNLRPTAGSVTILIDPRRMY